MLKEILLDLGGADLVQIKRSDGCFSDCNRGGLYKGRRFTNH